MKSRFATASAAAILAAGLILAPGLSPAQASSATEDSSVSVVAETPSTTEGAGLGGTGLAGSGNVASTYGMFFIPCNIFGLRLC
ncbi:hypothetical protein [Arthrobacter sp. HY1533]|uniref:hypothetical protein n=1 Tax=Arthrobacter sp. HY1533 TaxID=2970919 RepID=UPI0022B9FDC4|nr:hypothetical protein [Arthrobacter sp. HY1533]